MKKLFLIFLLFAGIGFSWLYYYWQQATQVPEWYTTQSKSTQKTLNSSDSTELIAAKTRLQEKIEASIAKSQASASESSLPLTSHTSSRTTSIEQETAQRRRVEVELSNQEVNELVITAIAQQTAHGKIIANAPHLQTTIKDGMIESGTVVNLSKLSANEIEASERAALEKLLKTFPFLDNQKIYIGISGQPQIDKGEVKWDNTTKIRLGNLSLSLSELSQQLGIPQEQIEQQLTLSPQLGKLKVNDMEVTDDKVVLRGVVD
jgi:hypothetical protein